MQAQDFYNKYKGQSLLVPGSSEADRGQCFMLFDYFIHENGLPYYYAPGAINIWENNGSYDLKKYFDFIPYSPQIPVKAGDIVVYGQGVGSPYGHVDVALQNGVGNNYVGMDQNWGHNLTVHQVNHNDSYNQYILGILRRKGDNTVMTDKLTPQEVTSIYTGFFRVPDAQTNQNVVKAFTGKPLDELLQYLHRDATYQKLFNQSNTPPTTGNNPVYTAYNGPQLYTKE